MLDDAEKEAGPSVIDSSLCMRATTPNDLTATLTSVIMSVFASGTNWAVTWMMLSSGPSLLFLV